MTTQRKFAGFSREAPAFRSSEIPPGGFCLSSFVLLEDGRGRVLMGKLNQAYDWDHIGALDDDRKQRHSGGWMLPSSHLMLGESPSDAASRILLEQLGLKDVNLERPEAYSESYTTGRSGNGEHWDLEFVFRGRYEGGISHPAWKELAFVDPNAPAEQFARNHQDILRSAHLRK